MRSDGFGYPVSSEAIRIARRLAAAERTSSLETKAQFSAATYESLSMVALGDTISYLKEQASSATDATTEVQPEEILKHYRSILTKKLNRAKMDLFRHIPCHIFHSPELNTNFEVGPVCFQTRDEWAKRYVADEAILSEVRRAWESPSELSASKQLTDFEQLKLRSILNTIGTYGWVGTVLIRNHDADNSHENQMSWSAWP
jgi:hypothetical protein